MTIIVFLVDTSASMQQKAFGSGRSTLLDVAKGAVEFFVKMRQKSPESRGDRFVLHSCHKGVLAVWGHYFVKIQIHGGNSCAFRFDRGGVTFL